MSKDPRSILLNQWATSLAHATAAGAFGKPIQLLSIETIRGPRVGALEIEAGMAADVLLKVLSAHDMAIARQFIPWRFEQSPTVFMYGRFLRMEAAWPEQFAENDIPLSSIGQHPRNGGRWIVGKNETGATIVTGVNDATAHYLFAGMTGAGKTYSIRNALVQLSRDPKNRLVLTDGKYGDGLGTLRGLPGLVGPVAIEMSEIRGALTWTLDQMKQRYRTGNRDTRLIVVADEVQEMDDTCMSIILQLVRQGRGAGVHVLVGTQDPVKESFGDKNIKRNLGGRIVQKVENGIASNVAVGGPSPRADYLLGSGDSYVIVPQRAQRVQAAYVPESELRRYDTEGQYELHDWPAFDPEVAGTTDEDIPYDPPVEIGSALLAAAEQHGRPWLRSAIADFTGSKPGGSKAQRLLSLGREVQDFLYTQGYCIHPCSEENSNGD